MDNPEFLFSLREDIKDLKEFLPTKAHKTDTGWDIRFCPEDRKSILVEPFQYIKLPTGIKTQIPDGWWLELRPRSSSFVKKHLHFLYGVIDQDFENQMQICGQFIPDGLNIDIKNNIDRHYDDEIINIRSKSYICSPRLEIKFGDAIGQLVPIKRQEMIIKEVSNEEIDNAFKKRNGTRGKNGFGSTGN